MRQVKSRCRCTKGSDTPPPRICETIPRYDFEVVREGRKREREKGVTKRRERKRERESRRVASYPLLSAIAASKMTSPKEESRVDIRRAPCNWKLLVNVNRFVLE